MHFTSWKRLKGKTPLKQTTTERGCSKSQEKHHKRRMQQFGDVSGSKAWCSYCKQVICYQILSVIYFHLLKFSFRSPKNWVVWYQRCYVLNSSTHLGVNTRKSEMLNFCLMFIFLSQPQMYSVYCKNKGIGLAVPILLEGNVYQSWLSKLSRRLPFLRVERFLYDYQTCA